MKSGTWKKSILYLFLISIPLSFPADRIDALHNIKKAGKITVITRNNAHCNYTYRDRTMGFGYELAEDFNRYLSVEFRVIPRRWEDLVRRSVHVRRCTPLSRPVIQVRGLAGDSVKEIVGLQNAVDQTHKMQGKEWV